VELRTYFTFAGAAAHTHQWSTARGGGKEELRGVCRATTLQMHSGRVTGDARRAGALGGAMQYRGQREWQTVQYIDSLAVPPLQTTDYCNIHVKTKERRAGMPPDKVGQWLAELAFAPLREEWIPPCDRRSARSLVGVRKR